VFFQPFDVVLRPRYLVFLLMNRHFQTQNRITCPGTKRRSDRGINPAGNPDDKTFLFGLVKIFTQPVDTMIGYILGLHIIAKFGTYLIKDNENLLLAFSVWVNFPDVL